jgi:hypothetical protein
MEVTMTSPEVVPSRADPTASSNADTSRQKAAVRLEGFTELHGGQSPVAE